MTKPHVSLAIVAVIACLAQFMIVLDSSIVNIALPAMRAGLGLSADSQQWIVDGYLIAFGGLLLLASRTSDLFGRRRLFQIGLVVFTAASLLGGLAQDGAMLLIARCVQGAGAAALGPSSLSLITASHHQPEERRRAMTWWGVAAATAGAAGMVLGGVLTAALSWRWVMFVNVPVGAGLLAGSFAALAPSTQTGARARIDAPAAISVTLAVAAIVYGISAAPQDQWGSPQVLIAVIVGIALLAVFLGIERRSAKPLVPLEIFAQRNVPVGNLLTVCMGAVITAPLFFLSLYLQQVLGDSALRAGLSVLPMGLTIGAGVLGSQPLLRRFGPKRLVLGGSVVAAVGLVWLAYLPTRSEYVPHVLLPTLVFAGGLGVTMLPAIAAATNGIDPQNAGVASGLLNMSRQIGAAVGLAALVTVASTITRHSSTHGAAGVVHGYHVAILAIAALSLMTAANSLLLQESRSPKPAPGICRADPGLSKRLLRGPKQEPR